MKFTKYEVRWDERSTDEDGDEVLDARSRTYISFSGRAAYYAAMAKRNELELNCQMIMEVLDIQISNFRIIKVTEEVVG